MPPRHSFVSFVLVGAEHPAPTRVRAGDARRTRRHLVRGRCRDLKPDVKDAHGWTCKSGRYVPFPPYLCVCVCVPILHQLVRAPHPSLPACPSSPSHPPACVYVHSVLSLSRSRSLIMCVCVQRAFRMSPSCLPMSRTCLPYASPAVYHGLWQHATMVHEYC